MKIKEVYEYSPEIHSSLNNLLPALSSSVLPIREQQLKEIIDNPNVHLLIAIDNQECLGTLTLVVFPTITGTRAWIEDVVVSEHARGQGIGKSLSSYAKDLSKKLGVKTIDLTSRSSREAANALYIKVGFIQRKTNIYRYYI